MRTARPKLPETTCTYCGTWATAWDHVVPVAALRPEAKPEDRYHHDDWIVPCCQQCNSMLSDRMLHSVPLRAKFLFEKYRAKYRKVLLSASWTEEELSEVSPSFAQYVEECQRVQNELDHRLAHLSEVLKQDSDYLRPKLGYDNDNY